jgi:diguanylate cyclase (GGDEF)-like protein
MEPIPHRNILEFEDGAALSAIVNGLGEAVVHLDQNWTVLYCNDTYLRFIGLPRKLVVGSTPFKFAKNFEKSVFYEPMKKCQIGRQEVMMVSYSAILDTWLEMRAYPYGDGFVAFGRRAVPSMVKQQELAKKAVVDEQTQLGNKLGLEERLKTLLERRAPASVVLIGLERLKDISDLYGYDSADAALLEAASVLSCATSSHEALFRVAAEEFAVVLTAEDPDVAQQRATELVESLHRPILLSGARVTLSAHAGIVSAPEDGDSVEVLLQRAGLALRDARRLSRDLGKESYVAPYRPELELASRRRAQLGEELRAVISGAEFRLVFQPKADLLTGAIAGAEALIRWQHPKRGILTPGVFLDIARDSGLMPALDAWVMRTTCEAIAQLAAQGHDTVVSINLSVESLSNPMLCQDLGMYLRAAGADPAMLEIEIPEGALMQDLDTCLNVLTELCVMGVRLSIDDFGAGYASFADLAQFPVATLKIDKSFVTDLSSSPTNRTIVQAIIRLAHALGKEVVAEGAESEDELKALRKMKCDKVQGYVISKPVPLDVLAELIRRHAPGRALPDATSI